MSRTTLAVMVIAASARVHAQALPTGARATAERRSGDIAVDGKLDEPAWISARRQGGFVQRFPKDGAKPDHDTQFAFLYDDEAIYVGVWADDPQPHLIRRLLTRRDVEASSDTIAVGIDSYHDRRTAYVFALNAAGVQRDFVVFDDSATDESWDAVWTGDVAILPTGWSAELRIPLNQLRFAADTSQVWGLQLLRFVARTKEQSTWSPWPRTSSQIVSRFGEVSGIDHLAPSRRLELLPYATGGFEVQPVAPGDPLNARSAALGNAGIDVKYGLGPAFTLSATVNPDFGQVEADPSQVNLSANELFFDEKRPFFVEGSDLFKLPVGFGDDQVQGAFYSRRIGAAPPEPDMAYEYIAAPAATTIYGAAKITGKTRGGWSIGLLDAVTGEERATIVDAGGNRMAPAVAPLTNYAVARLKRDLRGGKTTVGAALTAVDRELDDTALADALHDHAYTAGFQFNHRFGDDAWEADVHGVGSWVHGTPAAIARTQQSSRHLFQRPDADHVELDPTRNSLAGFGVSWFAGRSGATEHWRWALGGELRTPGLELNDAGFQHFADRIENWVWGEYRDEDPGDTVLNWRVNGVGFVNHSFEPRRQATGMHANMNAQLASYWSFHASTSAQLGGWDPAELRGGPALRVDPRVTLRAGGSSDERKRVRVEWSLSGTRDWTADMMDVEVGTEVAIQARSNIDIGVGPQWSERTDPLQYVAQVDDAVGKRHYIFARIRQTTVSLTARLNWTFSPRLSLQVYAQPFLAAGSYSEYKDVDHPHAARFADRFRVLDGTEYSLARPDFDVGQLRSTVVLRWEYRPGSAVYAIWSRDQARADDGLFHLGDGVADLARAPSENVVMVKANYWIGL